MNRLFGAFVFFAIILCLPLTSAHTGILAIQENILSGRKNLADPAFTKAVNDETGLGAAVNSLLTGSLPLGHTAKAAILRSIITAVDNLQSARGLYNDISAQKLYESLIIYDLMPDKSVFTDTEIESLGNNIRNVLNYYLDSGNYAWEDDRWSLGATAMRIVASEALYTFNFPQSPAADRLRAHSIRYFEKNLTDSIDDSGAWITDSPVHARAALEYLIITAKAFKNAGIFDAFSDPRLEKVLTWEIRLFPPPQSVLTGSEFMDAAAGERVPEKDHCGRAVIAAADILPYYPEAAENLLWLWNRCQNPVDPLGLLFIDTSIPPLEPEGESMLIGGGAAVLRNNFGRTDESYVFTDFGGVNGISHRNGHDYSRHGDFSFIWRGIPLVMHYLPEQDNGTNGIFDSAPWRHNLVLRSGAGDSPVLPESAYSTTGPVSDIPGKSPAPADFYPDGISQFFSTDVVDYAAGHVRLSKRDIPAYSHYRSFLFLKPDALLIWDKVESPFELEWNLWIHEKNIWAEGNILHIHTEHNVDLQVHFAGDTMLDYTTESYPEEITWDWPLVMRAGYGRGSITALCLNLFSRALADSIEFEKDLFRNILLQTGEQSNIGLITGNRLIGETISSLGFSCETLSYRTVKDAALSNYSTLVIGSTGSVTSDRILYDYGWKINEYIEDGGSVILLCRSNMPWLSDAGTGPGTLTVPLTVCDCPLSLNGDVFEVKLHDDPVWKEPYTITTDSWLRWINGTESESEPAGLSERVHANSIPVVWSDSWKVLASVPRTLPLRPYTDKRSGKPTRIRVKHPASKDFFTLLLPRMIGEASYLFDVKKTEPGFISFADPTTTWEIRAGETTWTDASLSVLIDSHGIKKMFAFDCTYIRVGTEIIQAASPMSIYYSESEDFGIIKTAVNNSISCSRHELRPYAGVIKIRNLFGEISLERLTYITGLDVVDEEGVPLECARVYGDDRFIGATDKNGNIPIRWTGAPPTVRVHYRGRESLINLVPGDLQVVMVER